MTQQAPAQSGPDLPARLDSSLRASQNALAFPIWLLVPRAFRAGYILRDYIASDAFGELSSMDSLAAFNEIWLAATTVAHGDAEMSLLASAYGSFEHEFVSIPLGFTDLHIPLTTESRSRFELRRSHIPRRIYGTMEDDRDKVQHFYASAWLKEAVGMTWLAKLAGSLVEFGEGLFSILGAQDPRDLHANSDGIRFASEAYGPFGSLPSQSLTPNPGTDTVRN